MFLGVFAYDFEMCVYSVIYFSVCLVHVLKNAPVFI